MACSKAGNAFLFAEARTSAVAELAASICATVLLACQKKAPSFTSHETTPVTWLWENMCCTVFCILSRCLPDRHSLSALHSNPAPCVCMRSPPGWRWLQILPCVPHPLLQIPSRKTHCLCISKQAPESEAGLRVHCS